MSPSPCGGRVEYESARGLCLDSACGVSLGAEGVWKGLFCCAPVSSVTPEPEGSRSFGQYQRRLTTSVNRNVKVTFSRVSWVLRRLLAVSGGIDG